MFFFSQERRLSICFWGCILIWAVITPVKRRLRRSSSSAVTVITGASTGACQWSCKHHNAACLLYFSLFSQSLLQVYGVFPSPVQQQLWLLFWEKCQLFWFRCSCGPSRSAAAQSENHHGSEWPCEQSLRLLPGTHDNISSLTKH